MQSSASAISPPGADPREPRHQAPRVRQRPRDFSASADRLAEDVGVVPVVVAELELGNIERQIFGTHLVESADNAALEDRPEAFDRLRMDRTDDVLARRVVDDAVRVLGIKPSVADPLVGAQQANLLRHRAAHESLKNVAAHAVDNPRDDLALALDSADYGDLARASAATSAPAALVPVPVLRLAADEGFIDLDDPHQLAEVLVRQPGSDAMAHVPGGRIGAEAHVTMDLQRADPLFAGQQQVNDPEPLPQWLIRVFEDRTDDGREAVVGSRRGARVAEVVPRHRAVRFDLGITAAWADDEFRPAMLGEVDLAGVFVREQPLEVSDRHLVDRLAALLLAGPNGSSVDGSDYSG